MAIFYKKWKNYNKIQLTKNKMDLNIRKMTNHSPSPVIWHQTQQICMYCNTLHNNGCQGNCCQLWLTSKQKQITYVSLIQFSLKAQVYQSTTISYVPLRIHIVYSQLHCQKKACSIQYGYRKQRTQALVFSQTVTHWKSKNEIRKRNR